MAQEEVGKVSHFFTKIGVAAKGISWRFTSFQGGDYGFHIHLGNDADQT